MSFKIVLNEEEIIQDEPISILDLIGNDKNIICALVNNSVKELTYIIRGDATVVPLTTSNREAQHIYEASLRYLISMAMHNIHPNYRIRFSINVSRSLFLQVLEPKVIVTNQLINELKVEMARLVGLDLPFTRNIVSKAEAKRIFEKEGYQDKVDIMKYRPEKTAHYYECCGYKNYMYSRMVPSSGYLTRWKLKFYSPGIIIQYPRSELDGQIPTFEDTPTFGRTLKRAHEYGVATNASTVVDINEHIKEDGIIDFINLCEANSSRQLCELGQRIEDDIENIRLICIAGPSSSGKTTFANRLRIELLSRGIHPIRISLDDYYLPKERCPVDEEGNIDLESIDALDIELFNENMTDLISGLEVELPHFDFQLGYRVPGRKLKIAEDEPIIIEGIHALNEKMSRSIPNHQKFKIFIAPQAQVNIDNENPLSSTDIRLLRRMVRDYQFRNSSAEETIASWDSVRKGEFKWIYDTEEGANFVFNSFLSYELCAMKKYCLPLLAMVDKESPYFPTAERLIRMLKFFVDMPSKWIPSNSLIREFIGGSCYEGYD
ncbi:MAG: hypothetical protein LUB56_01950 [Coprobacillus sp.]|nr:hypothetical protein [Coprobacillus sp.]